MCTGSFTVEGNTSRPVEWEQSGNIQGTFREYSGNIQGIFREHSGRVERTPVSLHPNCQKHFKKKKKYQG
jgi:hypothetical protein